MKNIKQMIEYPKQGILTKEIFENLKLDITLFCMAKDSKISGHTSTKQGFVYVLEGKGVFTLKGQDIEMSPGVFIHMDKNKVHSLKAFENTSFILTLTN